MTSSNVFFNSISSQISQNYLKEINFKIPINKQKKAQ